MTRQRFEPDDPREWLNRARGNLARSKVRIPESYLEDLCFDAQQAAEKAIKGVLIHRGIDFPYIHDLNKLLLLLERAGEQIPEAVRAAKDLSQFAVVTRYPWFGEPVTEQEYERAVKIADTVFRWAEGRIAG